LDTPDSRITRPVSPHPKKGGHQFKIRGTKITGAMKLFITVMSERNKKSEPEFYVALVKLSGCQWKNLGKKNISGVVKFSGR
jgi:hypothetical protein